MKRIRTDISGLDRLLEGGFPKGSAILLTGEPGTGKTILGLQYLYKGANKHNEPGMLIQAEDFQESLDWYGQTFGWDFMHLLKKQMMSVFSFKPKDYGKFKPQTINGEFIGKISNLITPARTQRIVFDSITPVGDAVGNNADYRNSFYKLVEFFKKEGMTSIIIAEEREEGNEFEEHVCDGVIKVRNIETQSGEFDKELMVSKMLATNIAQAWYPMTITGRGISIKPFL
jgi:circadian clock protein KaiC